MTAQFDMFACLPTLPAPVVEPAAPAPKPRRERVAQISMGNIVLDPHKAKLAAQRKARTCLSCLRSFDSAGPHNRICGGCRSGAEFKAGSAVETFAVRT